MQGTIAPVCGIHESWTCTEAAPGTAGGEPGVPRRNTSRERAAAGGGPGRRRTFQPLLFSPGPISRHVSFFLEVLGEGFLAVDTPRGRRYLRAGVFRCGQEGRVVGAGGFPLAAPVLLASEAEALVIAPEGEVFQACRGGAFRAAGRIELVGFARPGGLRWETGLGLAETRESGPPGPGGFGWIRCEPGWRRGWPTPEIAAAWRREREERTVWAWSEGKVGESFDGRA
ncbi:MAG: hypothetical protein ACK44W_01235 [Planctomycetota bacterium]